MPTSLRETAVRFCEFRASKAQQMMISDGLQAAAIISPDERSAGWRGKKLRPTTAMKFAMPKKDEDPTTRKLRREIEAADAKKKAERFTRLDELKAIAKKAATSATTPENAMLTTTTTATAAVAKATAPRAVVADAAKTAHTTKATEGKKAKPAKAKSEKKTAKKAAAKPAKKAKPAGEKKVDTVQRCADLMARKSGASMAELCKDIGIEPHPMRTKIYFARHRLGYDVTAPSAENGNRYFATLPKTKK